MQQSTIDCPVCPRIEIPLGEETCPGCGVALAPLGRLRELPLGYYNLALERHARGNLQGAVDAAACAQTLDPGLAAASILLGKLLWQSGERHRAIACWSGLAGREGGQDEARRLIAATTRKPTLMQRFFGRDDG